MLRSSKRRSKVVETVIESPGGDDPSAWHTDLGRAANY